MTPADQARMLPLTPLTSDDAPRRSLCGSCAGCPRAARRAAEQGAQQAAGPAGA